LFQGVETKCSKTNFFRRLVHHLLGSLVKTEFSTLSFS